MKLSIIFTLATAAGLVSSQCVSSIPECAQTCLLSAAPSAGCAADDYSCQCSPDNQSKIQSAATNCVVSGCGADTALSQCFPSGPMAPWPHALHRRSFRVSDQTC